MLSQSFEYRLVNLDDDLEDDDNNENFCDTSDSIEISHFNTIKTIKKNDSNRDGESDGESFAKNSIRNFGGESHQQQNHAGEWKIVISCSGNLITKTNSKMPFTQHLLRVNRQTRQTAT